MVREEENFREVQPIFLEGGRQTPDYSWITSESAKQEHLMRWQLDVMKELERMTHYWRGEVWNEQEKKWIVIPNAAPMNNLGVIMLTGELSTVINKITPLSNLSENDVRRISKDFTRAIAGNLYEDELTYELKRSRYQMLVEHPSHFVYILLNRARDEGERHFLQPILRYIEQVQAEAQKKQAGIHLFGGG